MTPNLCSAHNERDLVPHPHTPTGKKNSTNFHIYDFRWKTQRFWTQLSVTALPRYLTTTLTACGLGVGLARHRQKKHVHDNTRPRTCMRARTHTQMDMIIYHKYIYSICGCSNKPASRKQRHALNRNIRPTAYSTYMYIPEVTAQLLYYISLGFFNCHNEMPPDQLKKLHKADVAFTKPCRSHGYMTECLSNAKRANAISCHQGAHETLTAVEVNKRKVAGLLTRQFGVRDCTCVKGVLKQALKAFRKMEVSSAHS
jgi:hypothetical protein